MGAKHFKVAIGTTHALYCSDMVPTFKDLLDFVLANKTDKCFVGHSTDFIIKLLADHLRDEGLYYEQDLDGKIAGVILADFDHTRKVAFVTENLSMSIDRLGRFALKLKNKHPDYTIEAMRHGKHRVFNTEKLYKKLL